MKGKIKHGIDCPCNECAKIRDLLLNAELDGKIYLTGDKGIVKKIRRG